MRYLILKVLRFICKTFLDSGVHASTIAVTSISFKYRQEHNVKGQGI